MAKFEWFRRTTWTEDDRAEFNARLMRSRGASSKAQYLRIQASHLSDAGHHAAAIELLDRLLAEFPERGELAMAHSQRADSMAALGNRTIAIDEYRLAFDAERAFPNCRTNAYLSFGWLVVEFGLSGLYNEVLAIFSEFGGDLELPFPVMEYQRCAVLAVIAEAQGDSASARDFAVKAIAAASLQHSGFRYHANLGLVKSQPKWMQTKLDAIVGR
jgi:tetratricopeptide (TPR) repeat protein